LIRLQGYKVDNGVLDVDIQNTNYFSHIGTRERPEIDKENRADPLSVGSVLHTSDDYIVLGEKSGNVEQGAGEYHLPGAGFIEDPELQYERSLNAQPSSPIHRELEEEVNLTADQLTMPQPSALVGDAHRQPMLVYDANTIHNSEEVADEWAEIPEEDREFSELIFLPEESVNPTLEGEESVMFTDEEELENRRYEGSLRPHAEGALSLL
jgi:ADP-ribose pyrophosphatase YjhB (NUDIX family)